MTLHVLREDIRNEYIGKLSRIIVIIKRWEKQYPSISRSCLTEVVLEQAEKRLSQLKENISFTWENNPMDGYKMILKLVHSLIEPLVDRQLLPVCEKDIENSHNWYMASWNLKHWTARLLWIHDIYPALAVFLEPKDFPILVYDIGKVRLQQIVQGRDAFLNAHPQALRVPLV